MDAVLGLSMSPTSVGLILVGGQDADGATMDRDSFAIGNGGGPPAEQATAAVIRTEAMAANRGLRLHSIGVTWSEDSDLQASMLMESLSESGFDNVVAIRMPEATEALARGIAEVLGYSTTAVCVIEPQSVISLIVNTSDGAVQTAFNHGVGSDAALISWLSTVFTRADWAPEALVVVGSAGDFEPLLQRLEEALSVPVFAPEEAKLALARGAALASAQGTEVPLDVFADDVFDQGVQHGFENGFVVEGRVRESGRRHRQLPQYRRTLSRVGPVAMLATGAVTFVVSASIAISLQLSPTHPASPGNPEPAAKIETPEAARAVPPADPPPAVLPPVEAALPSIEPEAPPPVSDAPPVVVVDTPAEAPAVDQAPAAEPETPPAIPAPAVPAPTDPSLAPPVADPGVAPPVAGPMDPDYNSTQVPTKKPGLFTRIKERLMPGSG